MLYHWLKGILQQEFIEKHQLPRERFNFPQISF